jgi:GNAT superfamily N-acetyltransferase
MQIRRALGADVGEITEMWEALVAHHLSLDPDLPQPTADGAEKYARLLVTYMGYDEGRVFVAVNERGMLVGYILGSLADRSPSMFVPEPVGNIMDLYVRSEFRRQGIGRQLVDAMMTWFSEKQIRVVSWDVVAANAETHAFWKAVGGRDLMLRMQIRIES